METRQSFRTDPSNIPQRRPGAYLIRNLANGKCYVGISIDVARRVREHEAGHGKATLKRAIAKYGAGTFEAIPLLYSISGTDWLPAIEAELIEQWNCIAGGYNIQAASGAVGPYGSKFSEAIRASRSTPEYRAKRRAATLAWLATEEGKQQSEDRVRKMHSPEVRTYADERMRQATRTPEARAAASVRIRAIQAAPGFWEAHQEKRNATLARPEVKARLSAIHKARLAERKGRIHWITNGQTIRSVSKDADLPKGWWPGRK